VQAKWARLAFSEFSQATSLIARTDTGRACLSRCPVHGGSDVVPSSTGDEATETVLHVATSAGPLILHFYDWAWAEKRRTVEISSQLARGRDGFLFLYDVQSRPSLKDSSGADSAVDAVHVIRQHKQLSFSLHYSRIPDFYEWYERAAGFEKPSVVISMKNDSKKVQVQNAEGQALTRSRNRCSYVAVSLVDGSGVDDVVLAITRQMLGDANASVSSYKSA